MKVQSLLSLLSLLLLPLALWSQIDCNTDRYLKPIFDEVYTHHNVQYAEAQNWNFPYNLTELHMDIYEPIGDTLSKRPVMIWAHPGGFILGNKEVEDMVALCDTFARRGYVTVSIQYRLGYNPFDAESAERGVYRGTQDGRAAIRYLKEFHSIYDLDTTQMFIGGSSAGGFLSLHLAYLDEEERPLSTYEIGGAPDLLCLDCSGNDYQHTVDPKAIVNLWGALGDSTFRDVQDTIPVLMIHGTDDQVVAYGTGSPFDLDFLPVSHGSRSIANQSEAVGVPYELIALEGEDHEPHGTSNGTFNAEPTEYWQLIIDSVGQFYYEHLDPCVDPVSNQDLATSDVLQLYPNPSTGQVYIKMPKAGLGLSIVDLLGVQQFTRNDCNKQVLLDLALLPGLYILQCTDAGQVLSRETLLIR